MRAKFVNEKFKEDTDPVKDMDIGMSEAEAILQTALKLFGNREIVHKTTPIEKQEKQISWEWEIQRDLPMSINDWKTLKDEIGLKRIPNKYIERTRDRWGTSRDLSYCHLLKDIYGQSWYFDDMDLVQDDRTIVSLFGLDGLTFKQLIAHIKDSNYIKGSPRLFKKRK